MRRTKGSFFLLLAFFISFPFCADAADRYSVVHVPKNYDAKKPAPLLLVLHGYSLDADTIEEFSGLSELSDREGFIAVYPDGTLDAEGKRGWNAGPSFDARFKGADDDRYLVSLIEETGKTYRIDRERIYAVGYSNGGFMAHALALRHPGLLAGIGAVAASTSFPLEKLRSPVSVIHIHGLADAVVNFRGTDTFRSVPSLIDRCRALNGCTKEPIISRNGAVEGEVWRGSAGSVALYTIKGLGHEWPVNEMNTGEVLWNFLKTEKRK